MKLELQISTRTRLFLTGFIALLICAFAASAAGIYLGSARDVIYLLPGLMVMVPPSINMRGSISGVLASRLSSSMHLGAFEVEFSRDSVLGSNLRASFLSTVIIGFWLGLIVSGISVVFGIEGLSAIDYVVISVVSGIISGLIVMGITLLVVLVSYRFGLDLDMIAAPTVTTAGDIVTLPVLVITTLFFVTLAPFLLNVLFVAVLLVSVACVVYSVYLDEPVFEINREILPLLLILSFVGTLAGLTYTLDLEQLIEFAVFLIIIPPFTGLCGSIGGILCSRLATGMHMGEIDVKVYPERTVLEQFGGSYIYALFVFPLIGLIAQEASLIMGISSPGLFVLMSICTISGFVVITMVNLIAYATAGLSFRYGLDPDNFGIPVITSTIDLVGAGILVAVINILI
ncbi:magnesium transporter [Methanogenium marinum]|uniref:Magnesium transporter n=1 Tax=Methanogenium marinum TaxID=348610 RepID=A0A9Q4KS03_9EURY|nr:magnesium transporter [Methanogenium marinum]MDE4907484.1 magnesium transporter [Methanogenium marinum]